MFKLKVPTGPFFTIFLKASLFSRVMLKAILFDFWGTIVENGVFPSPTSQTRRMLRIQAPYQEFVTRFEKAFMTQKFPDLFKAFESVCEEFKIKPPQFIIDNLVGLWNKNDLLCKPFPETIEVLAKLKQKYKMALISNNTASVENVMEKFELRNYFNLVLFSFESGLLKSDPKMFQMALKKLKIKPEEALMVGDSLESDMKGAEAAGIRGILIDRNNRQEFADKITSLLELESKLK